MNRTALTTAGRSPSTHLTPPRVPVLLISMPFGPLLQPSIGLGLLKAALSRRAVPAKTLYFTLKFAELVGASSYLPIAYGYPVNTDMVGEWIFSAALFEGQGQDAEGYIREVLRGAHPDHNKDRDDLSSPNEGFIQDVLRLRSLVGVFLDRCLEEIVEYQPRVVAFTSIFQQQVASLALAQRLKRILPDTRIILGGANCEGPMGIEVIRQFPFVDVSMSGEGDIVFPQVVECILDGRSFSDLPGVCTRDNIEGLTARGGAHVASPVHDMDSLPYPDYDDFFEQYATSPIASDEANRPRLLYETSRGCWWGEKHHCTFCGLNGSTMAYRSKSATRALDELLYLTDKYPKCQVAVVDNILDMKYFKDFIPELAARHLHLELFYEVKANLRKEQVRLLRDAGIVEIQPGIESLSTPLLKMMRKGVRGLQNVQLLKWSRELGIEVAWNILWGFPDEPPQEYARLAQLVPLLTHLQPPNRAATVRLDRFSPNFDEADARGFVEVEPYPSYHYVYPLPEKAVANLAYYFTFRYRHPQDRVGYTGPVSERLAEWKAHAHDSALFYVDKGNYLIVWDQRPVAPKPWHVLRGLARELLLACDGIQTGMQLAGLAPPGTEPQDVVEILQGLLRDGLMLQDEDTYLSLVVPLGEYAPARPVLKRFCRLLQVHGTAEGARVVLSPTPSERQAPPPGWLTRVPSHWRLSPDQFYCNEYGELVVDFQALADLSLLVAGMRGTV